MKKAGFKNDVNNLRKKLADKRRGTKAEEIDAKYLAVTHCAFKSTGAGQKFARLSPVETVETNDTSLEGIKTACKAFFDQEGKDCVVMVNDKGTTVKHPSQLNLTKPFCVRFVELERHRVHSLPVPAGHSSVGSKRHLLSFQTQTEMASKRSMLSSVRLESSAQQSSSVAASVGNSSLMKIGQPIQPLKDFVSVTVEEFCVNTKTWGAQKSVKFLLDRKEFGDGFFRSAYHAKQIGRSLKEGVNFVVKRYKDAQKEYITMVVQGTVHSQTRKQVQMHMLARHFSMLLKQDAPDDYGQHIEFNKAYYAETSTGEPLFIEPFIEGDFEKYVNNDGSIFDVQDKDVGCKTEAFVHYTFHKSKYMAMALDIQGCGYTMTDPEFATKKLKTDDDEMLFCGGNLTEVAMNKFLEDHSCNTFCEKLGL